MEKTTSVAQEKLTEIRKLIEERGVRIFFLLEDLPIAMCVTDQNGYFDTVNEHYCRVYGYTSDELLGQHFTVVVPEAKREILHKLHDEFIQKKYELQGQWDVQGKDQRLIKILVGAAYVEDSDGNPYKVTFLVEMINDGELETSLDKVIRILLQDDRTFLSNDLFFVRLNVSGELDIINLLGLSEEVPEQYSSMQIPNDFDEQALSVIDILNGLLKMEKRIFVLERKHLDLARMIQKILSDLSGLFKEKHVRCSTFFDHAQADPWHSLPFDGDKIYLELMFQNIFLFIANSSVQGSEMNVKSRLEAGLISLEIEHTYAPEKPLDNKALERLRHLSFLVIREHQGDVTIANTREGSRKVTLILHQPA